MKLQNKDTNAQIMSSTHTEGFITFRVENVTKQKWSRYLAYLGDSSNTQS